MIVSTPWSRSFLGESMEYTPRLLVVEDEPIISHNITRHLEYLGYRIIGVASSAQEAQDIISESGADVVLMDIHLDGEVDGITLATIIQEEYSIPVVYLSGLMDDDTLERAKITHPFGYVSKPFTRRELQIAIEIALYKHKVEHQLRTQANQIRELLSVMNQGFCLINTEGIILEANRALWDILGLVEPKEQVKLVDFIYQEDQEEVFSTTASVPRIIRIVTSKGFPRKTQGPETPEPVRVILVRNPINDGYSFQGCFLSLTPIPEETNKT
jgi:CheY-like chemotaxis protein